MNYYDIYRKRVDRFGYNYQTRIQKHREKDFNDYLQKSVYRVDFYYGKDIVTGSLEPYSQDETQTLSYLLLPVQYNFDPGTVFILKDKDNVDKAWMVWWLEEYKARGYNKYVVLQMKQQIELDGKKQWCRVLGPGDSKIRDQVFSRLNTYYEENDNLFMMITCANSKIAKDQYYEFGSTVKQGFRVVGLDFVTTDGIAYVTLNPVYTNDETPAPDPAPDDSDDDYFWLNGGN